MVYIVKGGSVHPHLKIALWLERRPGDLMTLSGAGFDTPRGNMFALGPFYRRMERTLVKFLPFISQFKLPLKGALG
jgi:hypothetical protein